MPTPVNFAENPAIGTAKRIIAGPDNSEDTAVHVVTYAIDVVNTGDVVLSGVQIDDDLTDTFAGVSFEVVVVTVSDGACTAATSTPFDGQAETGLLEGTDSLAVGESCTIELTVAVTPAGNLGPFINQATASGTSPAGAGVDDVSTDGPDIDSDGDGDPTNNAVPTPFALAPPGEPDESLNNQAGSAVTVSPLGNDGDGTPLDPTTVQTLDPTTGEWVTELVVPGEGVWTVDPTTGDITFTPEDGFDGDPTPIDYRVKELGGDQWVESTVTITYLDAPASAGPLAFSGSSTRTVAGVALLMILLGSLLWFPARRRSAD